MNYFFIFGDMYAQCSCSSSDSIGSLSSSDSIGSLSSSNSIGSFELQ